MFDRKTENEILKYGSEVLLGNIYKSPQWKKASSTGTNQLIISDALADELMERFWPSTQVAVDGAYGEGTVDQIGKEPFVRKTKMHFFIQEGTDTVLTSNEGSHLPWLTGERKTQISRPGGFWSNYKTLLEDEIPAARPRFHLDETTERILGTLEDPNRAGPWDTRGLVMGHVQSGKTANYCGLINKAADAGYKLIIVLAGTYDNLRAQTQHRLDKAFIGKDSRPGKLGPHKEIGVGDLPGQTNKAVLAKTSAAPDGDLNKSNALTGHEFDKVEHPTILIVKKNVRILERLHTWLLENGKLSPEEKIAGVPLLLIDDEADHASVNTANTLNDPELDPTKTNKLIRQLLSTFEQSAYVAYTATPFANIFIPPDDVDEDVGEDLFPRSFIFSLEPPSNWVGPEQVFGLKNESSEAWPVRVAVEDSDEWIPSRLKAADLIDEDEFPESLNEALKAFLLSCAARRSRGHENQPMSMLIHVTPYVFPQNTVKEQVEHKVDKIKTMISGGDTALMNELRALWERDFVPAAEFLQKPGRTTEPPPVQRFTDIKEFLGSAAETLEVKSINGSSKDVLDYTNSKERHEIVIGAAKLARGVTLEGLSVSYYLRASRMYDTLMQMGRWFGYRDGYEDLCRLYTTRELMRWFSDITTATRELLDEFKEMATRGMTPANFGLKVRTSPGLRVTSGAKMRSHVKLRIGFSGRRPETTTFKTDHPTRQASIECLEELIENLDSITPASIQKSQDLVWEEVPSRKVLEYLKQLDTHPLDINEGVKNQPGQVADYIAQCNDNGGVTEWTVLFKSNSQTERKFPVAGHVIGLSQRRNRSPEKNVYSCGVLIGSADEAFDLSEQQKKRNLTGLDLRYERPGHKGLLILYLLDGDEIEFEPPATEVPKGPPFVGWCISLPVDEGAETVEYAVNNTYQYEQGQINYQDT